VKKAPTKPKLTKTQTMKTTTKVSGNHRLNIYIIEFIFKEAKKILGKQVLGDTRAETKRRQAAVNAKNVLQAVAKPTVARKANLKRLGTMANTARVSISSIIFILYICIYRKEKHTFNERLVQNEQLDENVQVVETKNNCH
jgi:hypothetical protein